jgi:hypothetical protein
MERQKAMQIAAQFSDGLSGWLALSFLFASLSVGAVLMALRKQDRARPPA